MNPQKKDDMNTSHLKTPGHCSVSEKACLSMKSSTQLLNSIMAFSQQHPAILAVYMNGSRANPKVLSDSHQDFDIVWVVDDVAFFVQDTTWIAQLGNVSIQQEPDKLDALLGMPIHEEDYYMFLLLFEDGNRLDLKILNRKEARQDIANDTLCVKLLDKDNLLRAIPKHSSDKKYWLVAPNEGEYVAVCNEFWWCLQNIAKGIVREEWTYAFSILENVARPQLITVLSWHIGTEHDFKVNVGANGKFLQRFLSPYAWQSLLRTYSGAQAASMWQALAVLMALFSEYAQKIADFFGWSYQKGDEIAIRQYIARFSHDGCK